MGPMESLPEIQLAVVRKGEKPQLYRLERERVLLGRDDTAGLVLDAPQITAQHARLEPANGGGWLVTDLGSDLGTTIDGQRLEPEVATPWDPGETLRIGPFFLRWRQMPGEASPAGERAPAVVEPAAEKPAPSKQIDVAVEPANLVVPPGGQGTLTIELANRGERVDHFTVDLSGLPREWVSTSHEFLRLAPGGSTSLPITIHPPEKPVARAGEYAYRLKVTSSAQETERTVVEGTVTVPRFADLSIELVPTRWRHGKPGRIVVHNEGNTFLRLIAAGYDPAEAIDFDGRRPLALDPGTEGEATMTLEAHERPLLIRERILPFTVQVQPAEGVAQEVPGELAVPPRFSLGCLLLAALPFVIVAVILAGISLGLFYAELPKLVAGDPEQPALQAYIREQWQDDLALSALTGDDGVWLAVMSELDEEVRQRWRATPAFPGEFVRQQWEAGWAITDLSFGNERWLLVMSEEMGPVAQTWRVTNTFPETFIETHRAAGYTITDLAFGNGEWAVVMTLGRGDEEQRWQFAPEFPEAFVREQWADGFAISDVAYGQDTWAVVMTETAESDQTWQTAAAFPVEFVDRQWQEGYDISEVARGHGVWAVVMTRRPGMERRQTWQVADRLR